MTTAEVSAPYGNGAGQKPPAKRVRVHHLREMKERGEPWPPVVEDTIEEELQQEEPTAAEPTEEQPSPNGSNGVHQPGQPSGQSGPPNYGAPPGWTPATVPGGKPHNVWEPKKPQPDQDERQ